MKVQPILFTLAFAISSSALAVEPVKSIPSSFQGTWNTKIANCKTHEGDGNLTLSSNEVAFYESDGLVKKVFVNSPLDIIVVAELSGEGDTWLSNIHLRLSPDKTSLIDVSNEKPLVRYRCPGHSR